MLLNRALFRFRHHHALQRPKGNVKIVFISVVEGNVDTGRVCPKILN